MLKRRDLVRAAAAAGIAATLPASLPGLAGAARNAKLLFMGGTGFIGPHMVRALVDAGCDVTLFNRGKTNPHLFPDLAKIRGDRTTRDIEQLAQVKWDLIVDTSCYIPRAVDLLLSTIDLRALRQYVLISTVLVYADFSRPGLHEGSALARMDEAPDSEDVSNYYGPLKVRCEQQAEKALPGRVTSLRCGQIVGPGDNSDQFVYWPERVAHGSEVLAPGSGDDALQMIDVRDLADWVVHCIGERLVGPYNTTSPAGRHTVRDLLEQCRLHLNPDATLTWVPAEFLLEQGIAPMSDLPMWVPPGTPSSGAWRVDTGLAAARGLHTRPLARTVVDTHRWFETLPEKRHGSLKAGISLERQAAILAAWHASNEA